MGDDRPCVGNDGVLCTRGRGYLGDERGLVFERTVCYITRIRGFPPNRTSNFDDGVLCLGLISKRQGLCSERRCAKLCDDKAYVRNDGAYRVLCLGQRCSLIQNVIFICYRAYCTS